MDEETLKAVKDYLKSNLRVSLGTTWGHFEKLIKVEISLEGEVISYDTITATEIREDF